MFIFKLLVVFIVLFAIADFGLSFGGIEIWGDLLGVHMPEEVTRFTPMLELAIGGLVARLTGLSRTAKSGASQG